MIICNDVFAEKSLTKKLDNYKDRVVGFYNLNKNNPVGDMLRLQKVMRAPLGQIIEENVNADVFLKALQNTKNTILKDYQIIICENDDKTSFIINPVSLLCESVYDLPEDWFNKYIGQIQYAG